MPAASVMEKPHKDNFAIRGLQVLGFMRSRRSSVSSTTSPAPKIVVHVGPKKGSAPVTIASLALSTSDLHSDAPLSPPPPYLRSFGSSVSSTSSRGSLTGGSSDDDSAADAAAAARRRSRRLSKPPPANFNASSALSAEPSSPLARAASASSPALVRSPSSSPTPSATSPSPIPNRNAERKSHKSSQANLDSTGRSRPPVSGVHSSTPPTSKTSSSTSSHTYHYKRARSNSASSPGKRTQDAILCLEALLDACESGAISEMRHVVEQVALARGILAGDDDGIGLVKAIRVDDGDRTADARELAAKLGSGRASSSVTSLATLSNLVVA